MKIENRSVVVVILLSLFTCGIYPLYWIYVVSDEIERSISEKGRELSSPGLCVLFSLITCGIYQIYWIYMQSKRIYRLGCENNVSVDDNSLVNVLLGVFSATVVSTALMQNDLNRIADNAVRVD